MLTMRTWIDARFGCARRSPALCQRMPGMPKGCTHTSTSTSVYLDLPTRPPAPSPARAPPQGLFAFDQTGEFDPTDPEPIPETEFDQSMRD